MGSLSICINFVDAVALSPLTLETDGVPRRPCDSSYGDAENSELRFALTWPCFVQQHASTRSVVIDRPVKCCLNASFRSKAISASTWHDVRSDLLQHTFCVHLRT